MRRVMIVILIMRGDNCYHSRNPQQKHKYVQQSKTSSTENALREDPAPVPVRPTYVKEALYPIILLV